MSRLSTRDQATNIVQTVDKLVYYESKQLITTTVCTQYLRKRIVSHAVVWFIQRKHDKLRDKRNNMLNIKLVNFNNIMIIY